MIKSSNIIQNHNEVLDKHASIIEKKIRDRHHQPWFNDKIKNEIILRRKKEGIWLKEQSEYSLNASNIDM